MNLKHLKDLMAKATAGKWSTVYNAQCFGVPLVGDNDTDFILALVNAAPSLIAYIEAAEKLRERLENMEISQRDGISFTDSWHNRRFALLAEFDKATKDL